MIPRLFAKIPTGYNADIFGQDYSDMSAEEAAATLEVYDAIISSLLPDWLRRCGDELFADFDTDDRECGPEVVEDFDINDVLADAREILWSHGLDVLVAQYLSDSTDD